MTSKIIYKTFSFYNSVKTFVLTWLLSKRLKTFGREIRINAWCHFGSKKVSVGDYCNFNGMTVAGCGELNIKNGFHSGTNILVITSNHDYYSNDHFPYGYDDISKPVFIGNAVWVGSNVTILPGAKVGDGVILQAGSVVHGSLASSGIYGGNPAKLIKKRENAEKCRSLISTGCYIRHK